MISVFGSINMDLIATTDRLPTPGETLKGNHFSTAPGGKGANQALAAARAGGLVKMAGAIGADNFGPMAVALLKEAKIDLSGVKQSDAPTGTALILVGADGENMIAVVAGANGDVSPQDANALIASMAQGDYLLLQMEISADAVHEALQKAQQRNITTVFNIAPITSDIAQLAPLADIIVANETEFDLLIGKGTLSDDQRLAEMAQYCETHERTMVVTLGAEGVIAQHDGSFYKVAGLTIEPIDTVGAGDTFCGYLTQGLDQGLGFEKALRRAAVAGSLACLSHGAQPAIPTDRQVAEKLDL